MDDCGTENIKVEKTAIDRASGRELFAVGAYHTENGNAVVEWRELVEFAQNVLSMEAVRIRETECATSLPELRQRFPLAAQVYQPVVKSSYCANDCYEVWWMGRPDTTAGHKARSQAEVLQWLASRMAELEAEIAEERAAKVGPLFAKSRRSA